MENHTQQKLYGLDHLRAFAISVVFFFHYFILSGGMPAWLPDVAQFGWTGVDLFFVLSGFLISSQLFAQIKENRPISFKAFFLKRFFRIIPAYLITIAFYFCLPFFREKEQLPPIWKFLSFTQNFGLDLKSFGTFSHAWSLCVEEHFYLFLPLILILFQYTNQFKKAWYLLPALFVFGFAIRNYSFNHLYLPYLEDEKSWIYWYKYLYYPTYNRLDGLLIGVSIAGVYQFLPDSWNSVSRYGNLLLLAGLCVLTGAFFLCVDQQTYTASVFGFPLIAIGYGCIAAGAISPRSILYQWNSSATTFIASISYALYLTHKGVVHMTHQVLAGFNFDPNILLIISAITCIGAAYLLHISVEKPFMKWRNRLLNA